MRAHGLPTKLNKGVIELTTAHTVRPAHDLEPLFSLATVCAWQAVQLLRFRALNSIAIPVLARTYAKALRVQVCTTGKKLNAHQAALLRHLDIKMAVASLRLAAAIDKEGNFREYEHDASWSDQDDTAELGFDDGLPDSMMLPAILPQH